VFAVKESKKNWIPALPSAALGKESLPSATLGKAGIFGAGKQQPTQLCRAPGWRR